MGTFVPPDWASEPKNPVSLEVYEEGVKTGVLAVDKKPFYTIGRDGHSCDISPDDKFVSRLHAVIVHHVDGRCFIIDMKSTSGTKLDGTSIPGHKPTAIKDGTEISIGEKHTYIVNCASSDNTSAEPQTVEASHILVKHRDSRRPASWKEPNITRSKEEALAIIQNFRQQLVSGEVDFATLASTESDCSSARRGGDLGQFGRGMMQAPFENATYALEIDELSQPVFSDSGIHLIVRTG